MPNRRSAEDTYARYGCLFLAIHFIRASAWVALAFLLVTIVIAGSGWATLLDALVLLFTALIGLGVWVERRMSFEQCEGQAFRKDGGNRDIAMLVVAVLATWIVANVLGNHIFHQ